MNHATDMLSETHLPDTAPVPTRHPTSSANARQRCVALILTAQRKGGKQGQAVRCHWTPSPTAAIRSPRHRPGGMVGAMKRVDCGRHGRGRAEAEATRNRSNPKPWPGLVRRRAARGAHTSQGRSTAPLCRCGICKKEKRRACAYIEFYCSGARPHTAVQS